MKNGDEVSESVGNTVGKGEIARNSVSKDLYIKQVTTMACLRKG